MGFMGGELSRKFGEAHVAVGMLFGQGSFRAGISPPPTDPAQPRQQVFSVGQPDAGSYEAMFGRAASGPFAVDLRQLPNGVEEWFKQPRLQRDIGNRFSAGKEADFYERIILPDEFDIVLYLPVIGAATPAAPVGRAR
jgi:erythromycin esterase-like protein